MTQNREFLIEAHHAVEVVWVLVSRDFLARYKHTLIGIAWSAINPLFFLLIFYAIFYFGLNLPGTPRLSGLFAAILSWQWMQAGLYQSAWSITGNSNLVGQPGFPVLALPVVSTVTASTNFLIALPLLFGFVIFEGNGIGVNAFWFPVIAVVQFVTILALSYLVAALNVTFRDVEQILPVILQLGYFITPIFYELSSLSSRMKSFVMLNPVTHLVEAYRASLLRNEAPDWRVLSIILILSLATLVFTMTYFHHARSRFLEEL